MTPQQIEDEKKRAVAMAASIGGLLAAILGLRAATQKVMWDAGTARFIVDNQYISLATIRRELQRLETAVGVKMTILTGRFAKQRITLDEWKAGMKQLIGTSHVLAAALGAGTIATAAENIAVQRRIAKERQYADRFAAYIETNEPSAPSIRSRATSYLLAAGITYGIVSHMVKRAGGQYIEARRILTARESCAGCRRVGYQWYPIDEIPPIGSLDCSSRCRCYLEYR